MPWYDWPMEFTDRVRVRRVRQIREVGAHVLGRLGDDGVGLLPSEEIIGLGRGSPSVDFSGGMPSKIHLHAVAVRERVGGLGLAVVCAGRQCERTASVLPVRGLPGSIIALVVTTASRRRSSKGRRSRPWNRTAR